VPEPAWRKPTEAEFWLYNEQGQRRPNADFLKDHFFREGRLTEEQALFILEEATDILSQEQNMLEINGPVTSVCPSLSLVGRILKDFPSLWRHPRAIL
jgi:serine/threonine-protein phosphatase 2B catalytic subunit